jgi:hypothetical protein
MIDLVASKALGQGLEICSYIGPEIRTVTSPSSSLLSSLELSDTTI